MQISPEKIAPAVAFVLAGVVLLVIGATGVVPLGNPQPTISSAILRVVMQIGGMLLMVAAIVLVWKELEQQRQSIEGFLVDRELHGKGGSFVEKETLNGKWNVYYGADPEKGNMHAVGSADIVQKQNKFRMTVHLFLSKNGRSSERVFENVGVRLHRQIITEFKSIYPKNSFMVGTMILYASHDGVRLHGGAMYLNDNGKVIVDRIVLTRD